MNLKVLLDFAENNVNVCNVYILAINDVALLAHLCKVLSIHFFSRGVRVSMDRKLLKSGLQVYYQCCGLSHTGTDNRYIFGKERTNIFQKHQYTEKN